MLFLNRLNLYSLLERHYSRHHQRLSFEDDLRVVVAAHFEYYDERFFVFAPGLSPDLRCSWELPHSVVVHVHEISRHDSGSKEHWDNVHLVYWALGASLAPPFPKLDFFAKGSRWLVWDNCERHKHECNCAYCHHCLLKWERVWSRRTWWSAEKRLVTVAEVFHDSI